MTLALYAHPFSSYSQKALVALYANHTAFEYRSLEEAAHRHDLEVLWPIKRFPVLVDGERTVVEATAIIEYLQVRRPGPLQLLPEDPMAAVGVRMLDTAYAWLERHLADGRRWAAGDAPSLADCGAAPFLFYADWTHRIPDGFRRVHGYRARLLAWPPFARAVDEARPFRGYFPLGAPDRD